MKNILLLTLTLLLTNCETTNKVDSEEFISNSTFVEIHESDTTWISFRDSTYEMWTVKGQQQNGMWKLKAIKNIEFLTLGDYCTGVYEILQRDDQNIVIKEVKVRKSQEFTLTKVDSDNFERRIKKIQDGS